ncbi:hypothetical protein T484DRAFT_1791413 [Baffinella frigidus]|nr:hypothetical protein T484DRAFT_1791413 [Cryptophyta sp. CCMP2293]
MAPTDWGPYRSPSLLHLDFGDCTVVDDKVIWQIGKSCPNLLTLRADITQIKATTP